MTKKYKLTHNKKEVFGHTLHQIKALKDFGEVKKGDLGGWIESQDNLSQTGLAWVYDGAKVWDNAYVYGNAGIYGYAQVYDNAEVSDHARIFDSAQVRDKAWVYDNARVFDHAQVFGSALLFNDAQVYEDALVGGNVTVHDKAKVYGVSDIKGDINIRENDEIKDNGSYLTFINNWSSKRQFVYVLSNQRWHVGCFDGTGEELIKKAYKDSELSGKMYELYVHFAEQVVKTQQLNKGLDNVQ